MGLRRQLIAFVIAMAISPAAAAPIEWTQYQVAETGATVDIPSSIFSEQAESRRPDMEAAG